MWVRMVGTVKRNDLVQDQASRRRTPRPHLPEIPEFLPTDLDLYSVCHHQWTSQRCYSTGKTTISPRLCIGRGHCHYFNVCNAAQENMLSNVLTRRWPPGAPQLWCHELQLDIVSSCSPHWYTTVDIRDLVEESLERVVVKDDITHELTS